MQLVQEGDWDPFPPMHDSRSSFARAAVAGCILVAGGHQHRESAEVFDEVLGRWLRLPCDLPRAGELIGMGSTLL
jgi:hypothetical protein